MPHVRNSRHSWRTWQPAQIIAIDRQHIERAELDFLVVLAGKQGIEIRDAIDAQDDGLAIDHKVLLPVLQRALDNPGKAVGPVVAVARQKTHPFVIPDDDQPVAVILDLMEPFRSGRDRPACSRNAGRIGASHVPQIGIRNKIANRRL